MLLGPMFVKGELSQSHHHRHEGVRDLVRSRADSTPRPLTSSIVWQDGSDLGGTRKNPLPFPPFPSIHLILPPCSRDRSSAPLIRCARYVEAN